MRPRPLSLCSALRSRLAVAAGLLAATPVLVAGCGSESEPPADTSAQETRGTEREQAPEGGSTKPDRQRHEDRERSERSRDDETRAPRGGRDGQGGGDSNGGGSQDGGATGGRDRGADGASRSVDEALEEEGVGGEDLEGVTRPGGRTPSGGGRPDRASPSR
jgi:hypothetical protein